MKVRIASRVRGTVVAAGLHLTPSGTLLRAAGPRQTRSTTIRAALAVSGRTPCRRPVNSAVPAAASASRSGPSCTAASIVRGIQNPPGKLSSPANAGLAIPTTSNAWPRRCTVLPTRVGSRAEFVFPGVVAEHHHGAGTRHTRVSRKQGAALRLRRPPAS